MRSTSNNKGTCTYCRITDWGRVCRIGCNVAYHWLVVVLQMLRSVSSSLAGTARGTPGMRPRSQGMVLTAPILWLQPDCYMLLLYALRHATSWILIGCFPTAFVTRSMICMHYILNIILTLCVLECFVGYIESGGVFFINRGVAQPLWRDCRCRYSLV